jgi:hypothetical protein
MSRKFLISIFFLCSLKILAQDSTSVLDERVSITFTKANLPTMLRQLNRQTKISFSYNARVISKEQKFDKTYDQVTLRDILNDLLSTQNLYFRELNGTIYVLKEEFNDRKIQGQILDAQTGAPLMFANVWVDNSTLGSATDKQGAFEIENVPNTAVEVVASYVGYKSKSVRVDYKEGDVSGVKIELELDAIALESIQVVGKTRRRLSKEEKRSFKNFKDEFMGRSDNADDCEIINPQILNIEILDSANNYSVTADEILYIENEALGYRIGYLLDEFRFVNGQKKLVGNAKFEEMEPRSRRQFRRWQEAREAAYRGSLQHFLNALIENRIDEEGFLVNVIQYDSVTSEYTTPLSPPPLEEIIQVSPTEDPFVFSFTTNSDIEITFTLAYEDDKYKKLYRSSSKSGNYKYTDKKSRSSIAIGDQKVSSYQVMGMKLTDVELFQKSIIFFEKKELKILYPGQFTDGSAYRIGGWWRWGAFSDMVPLNYRPADQE